MMPVKKLETPKKIWAIAMMRVREAIRSSCWEVKSWVIRLESGFAKIEIKMDNKMRNKTTILIVEEATKLASLLSLVNKLLNTGMKAADKAPTIKS